MKPKNYFSVMPFVLALLVAIVSQAYAIEKQANDLRPFYVTKFKEAGLEIYIPSRPQWNFDVENRNGNSAVILSTPHKFYPKASMEIVLNNHHKILPEEFKSIAYSALNEIRNNAGADELENDMDLVPTTYGDIVSLEDNFTIKHGATNYTAKSIMGLMPSGKPINIFLVTEEGKMDHILNIASKVWKNIKEI